MPTEKDLLKAFKLRQKLMEAQRKRLESSLTLFERKLLDIILDRLLNEIHTSEGFIKSNRKEVNISHVIDKIFTAFQRSDLTMISQLIATDFASLLDENSKYYGLFESASKGNRFNTIKKEVYAEMRRRMGINENGKMTTDGYLDRLIKNVTLREEVKKVTLKAVATGRKLSEFRENLRVTILGSKSVDGGLVRYYKTFAYDTYQNFDALTNRSFAKRLDLKYFVYSGGLIEASRDFCIKRNNKTFSTDETLTWKDDPTLPRTTAEKDSGNLSDYDPLVDRGRWNCRHMIRFISEQQAQRLRPDLFP